MRARARGQIASRLASTGGALRRLQDAPLKKTAFPVRETASFDMEYFRGIRSVRLEKQGVDLTSDSGDAQQMGSIVARARIVRQKWCYSPCALLFRPRDIPM